MMSNYSSHHFSEFSTSSASDIAADIQLELQRVQQQKRQNIIAEDMDREMERVRREERAIERELQMERSRGRMTFSHDWKLNAEREAKIKMEAELNRREEQIKATNDIIERQSQMLQKMEANMLAQTTILHPPSLLPPPNIMPIGSAGLAGMPGAQMQGTHMSGTPMPSTQMPNTQLPSNYGATNMSYMGSHNLNQSQPTVTNPYGQQNIVPIPMNKTVYNQPSSMNQQMLNPIPTTAQQNWFRHPIASNINPVFSTHTTSSTVIAAVQRDSRSSSSSMMPPVQRDSRSSSSTMIQPVHRDSRSSSGTMMPPVQRDSRSSSSSMVQPVHRDSRSSSSTMMPPVQRDSRSSSSSTMVQPVQRDSRSSSSTVIKAVQRDSRSSSSTMIQAVQRDSRSGSSTMIPPVQRDSRYDDPAAKRFKTQSGSVKEIGGSSSSANDDDKRARKGVCFWCKKYGHYKDSCPEKRSSSGKGLTGDKDQKVHEKEGEMGSSRIARTKKTCYYCREYGHLMDKCPVLLAKKASQQEAVKSLGNQPKSVSNQSKSVSSQGKSSANQGKSSANQTKPSTSAASTAAAPIPTITRSSSNIINITIQDIPVDSPSTDELCKYCNIKIHNESHYQDIAHKRREKMCMNGCKVCCHDKFDSMAEYKEHFETPMHKYLMRKKQALAKFNMKPYSNAYPIGSEYVIPVQGYFCKICKKFYVKESYAKKDHCSTKEHYDVLNALIATKCEAVVSTKYLQIKEQVTKNNKNPQNLKNELEEAVRKANFSTHPKSAATETQKETASVKQSAKEISKKTAVGNPITTGQPNVIPPIVKIEKTPIVKNEKTNPRTSVTTEKPVVATSIKSEFKERESQRDVVRNTCNISVKIEPNTIPEKRSSSENSKSRVCEYNTKMIKTENNNSNNSIRKIDEHTSVKESKGSNRGTSISQNTQITKAKSEMEQKDLNKATSNSLNAKARSEIERQNARARSEIERQNAKTRSEMERQNAKKRSETERQNAKTRSEMERKNLNKATSNSQNAKSKSEMERSNINRGTNNSQSMQITKTKSEMERTDLNRARSSSQNNKTKSEMEKTDLNRARSNLQNNKTKSEMERTDLNRARSNSQNNKTKSEMAKTDLNRSRSNSQNNKTKSEMEKTDLNRARSNSQNNKTKREIARTDLNRATSNSKNNKTKSEIDRKNLNKATSNSQSAQITKAKSESENLHKDKRNFKSTSSAHKATAEDNRSKLIKEKRNSSSHNNTKTSNWGKNSTTQVKQKTGEDKYRSTSSKSSSSTADSSDLLTIDEKYYKNISLAYKLDIKTNHPTSTSKTTVKPNSKDVNILKKSSNQVSHSDKLSDKSKTSRSDPIASNSKLTDIPKTSQKYTSKNIQIKKDARHDSEDEDDPSQFIVLSNVEDDVQEPEKSSSTIESNLNKKSVNSSHEVHESGRDDPEFEEQFIVLSDVGVEADAKMPSSRKEPNILKETNSDDSNKEVSFHIAGAKDYDSDEGSNDEYIELDTDISSPKEVTQDTINDDGSEDEGSEILDDQFIELDDVQSPDTSAYTQQISETANVDDDKEVWGDPDPTTDLLLQNMIDAKENHSSGDELLEIDDVDNNASDEEVNEGYDDEFIELDDLTELIDDAETETGDCPEQVTGELKENVSDSKLVKDKFVELDDSTQPISNAETETGGCPTQATGQLKENVSDSEMANDEFIELDDLTQSNAETETGYCPQQTTGQLEEEISDSELPYNEFIEIDEAYSPNHYTKQTEDDAIEREGEEPIDEDYIELDEDWIVQSEAEDDV